MSERKAEKLVASNKKANFDYFIDETYECGIVLTGTEIKAIRNGKVSLQDAFCYIKKGEVFLSGLYISKYEMGNIFNHQPDRTRKLLLQKREILKLSLRLQKEGYTLIPIRVVLRNGLAKVDIGLAKGKKNYDKREDQKKRDSQKEIKEY
ncbi:MAG: SsrA-binding protein SmpB [Prevotella sp.]|nr:SsrA-binding protein SmpB [Staphylococcus sp.]MCM1350071.1 SsrA-binding protein SmpB [Prevotella sp.]